ncbi:MAG TPA: hypothetical protein VF168_12430 [Trueperaceae bacterium]
MSADPPQILSVVIPLLFIGVIVALGGDLGHAEAGFAAGQQVAVDHQREAVRQELDALDRLGQGLMAPERVGRPRVIDLVARQQLLIEDGRSRAAARVSRQIAILNEVIRSGDANAEFLAGVEQRQAALVTQLERLSEGR